MAYPTLAQLNFVMVDNLLGQRPITGNIDTVQQQPLGRKVRGWDVGTLQYGEGEFIYLAGVASGLAGSAYVFDEVAKTVTLTVAASRGPVAIAQAAALATQFCWYQIRGACAVNTTAAGTGAANAQLSVTATAGQLTVGSAGNGYIVGATCKTAQNTPTTGFTQVQLSYPVIGGFTASSVG
jgi:hypothetical protein